MPFELRRQFGLMRELDERSCRLQQQVDADVLQQLKAAAERQQGKLGQAQPGLPGLHIAVGVLWVQG